MDTIQGCALCQLACVCACVQGLVGRIPNLGGQICSKMSSLSLQDTSLMQCNATHLSALQDGAISGQVSLFGVNSSCNSDFLVLALSCRL